MDSQKNSTDESWLMHCVYSQSGLHIVVVFIVVWGFLFFPLYFFVLRIGFQRWRANKRAAVSHTDLFTYHNFFFELLYFCGYVLFVCGSLLPDFDLMWLAVDLGHVAYPGVLSFQLLTCIERYLAVVYPVVYLSLRKEQWIRTRNVIILVIWVVSPLWMYMGRVLNQHTIPDLSMMATMATVIVFCNIQVLRALRNPSPGEGRGVSQSKRKAFYTMSSILSCLVVWCSTKIVREVLETVNIDLDLMCNLQTSGSWFKLPSSLVLPLLFLHRAGKIPTCPGKKIKNSG